MPFPKDVYESGLLELGHGLPLYDPDPASEYDKVRIFDVGYVNPRFGRFHRIFNAALPKEDEINRQHGTPADFVPLDHRMPATYFGSALPAGAMHSSHVRVLGSEVGITGDCVPAHAMIRFSVSNHQGAALVIKHRAYREDAKYENEMAKYMLKNCRSWLTYIRDEVGCSISLHDLVFVTGCDLTADWATAAFVEKSSECSVDFKAGDTSFGAASASFWGTWQSSVNVPHRCGPGPVRPPDSTLHLIASGEASQTGGPTYNQCIFLRSFRVYERRLRTPRVIKAAAEPEDMDMDRDGELPPAIPSTICNIDSHESMSDSSNDDYGKFVLSKNDKTVHDIIADSIFANSDADVALVHDMDVSALLKLVNNDLGSLSDPSLYASLVVTCINSLQTKAATLRDVFHSAGDKSFLTALGSNSTDVEDYYKPSTSQIPQINEISRTDGRATQLRRSIELEKKQLAEAPSPLHPRQ